MSPLTQHPAPGQRARCAFTLPAVMVVMAAVLTMAIGLLLVVGIERRSAHGAVDRRRAELAARSGLEELRAVLLEQTANDEFLILEKEAKNASGSALDPAAHLFLARAKPGDDGFRYRFHPLFSAASMPPDSDSLVVPDAEPLIGGDSADPARIPALTWTEDARVAWIPLKDSRGRIVARYAYWAEDLQGRIDAATAGNTKGPGGTHARNQYPFPAPGLNPAPEGPDEPALDRIALHVLDPASGADDKSDIDKRMIDGRKAMVSPDSVLAAAEFQPPLKRGPDGHLADPLARALEENTVAGLRPYLEQPLVPPVPGIASSAVGKPKLNLNALLAMDRDAAVGKMAEWIAEALPEFAAKRKGGFPDDYLRTLAANALDYADADSDASVKDGAYRGLDAYPLASEFLMRFRWEGIRTENGRKYVLLSASTYVELWNMTDQPAAGEARITFETAYTFPLGPVPSVSLGDSSMLDDPKVVKSNLEKRGDRYWFPAFDVNLKPGEYHVFKAGEVEYKIDAGPSSVWIPSPIELENDDDRSGYRLEWNGRLVDQSRGLLRRYNATLHYPKKPRQKVRATIPGHSYKRNFGFINNMGDPRIAFYNQAPQDANRYPANYSPNRRTIRWGTIYKKDKSTKPKIYGRVLPSEWPDGGHDSSYGSNAFVTDDAEKNPDDPRFFTGLPTPRPGDAPQRISNRGRFFSAAELGRVWDPVMWDNGLPTGAGKPWPDVKKSSKPSGDYGGGNTLRIGRPEHPRFDAPALRAVRLLDLFHAGRPRSDEAALREGPLVKVEGRVNLNTAHFDALRALAAGHLGADPELARVTSKNHETKTKMASPTAPLKLSAPSEKSEADIVARAIMDARPFAGPSQLAEARDAKGRPVFGNRKLYPDGERIQWADAAAEEIFARVCEASTVRSRNFRLWVIGQALAPKKDPAAKPEVLAESRMVFDVFADPGKRNPDGSIDPARNNVKILYENTF
jgi:hypothetical protein